jgi:hypothetical protein
MLRQVLGFSGDSTDTPVMSEMLAELTEIFADADGGSYDVDAVLFTLAISVIRLERTILERDDKMRELKADLLNLEARILEAGLPLGEPD